MKCPRCAEELVEVQVHGIAIDRCTACGGILLDKGETEAIDELDLGGVIEGGAQRESEHSHDGTPAHCYVCDRAMIELTGAGDIDFDWCEGCERVFFDRGELAQFDALDRS